jgi:hypothetical protein
MDLGCGHAQVLRYRKDRDGSYLIALTKYPPKPGAAWLHQHKCHTLRWQEVHRALSRKPRSPIDGFLFTKFRHYLEELGMAHREDLRIRDLTQLHKLFRAITGPKRYNSAGRDSVFSTADACLGVLDEVVEALLVTFTASRGYGPARRASRIDSTTALRQE